MTCGIYKITNTINDKVYIGQSKIIEIRFRQHISELKGNYHHNNKLQNSFNKYGVNSFKFETITECCIGLLDNLEIYYINKFKSNNRLFGFNLESGGSFNKTHSEETKLKMSKSRLGMSHSEETKLKMSKSRLGVKHSEERKLNVSKSLLGNTCRRKPVICLLTGIVWDSAKEASDIYDMYHSILVNKLNGRIKNDTNLRYVDSVC